MTTTQSRRSAVRSTARIAAIVAIVSLSALGIGRAATPGTPTLVAHPSAAPTPAPASPRVRTDAEIRDLDIEFYSARFRRDPTGAMDLSRLSALYLQRGRETGDPRDAILAEQAARQSLKNRPLRNAGARQVLTTALLAQHRFDEALPLAKATRAEDPDNPSLRAAVGDVEMELGQYDSARVSFSNLHVALGDPAVAPRLARWAEIEGDPAKARLLLHASLVNAMRLPLMPKEQLAWFWLRVGDVELRSGHLARADSAYRAGLRAHPDDYRLLAALAHSALVQHRWQRATVFGEQAIAVTLDPATLGILSDAYSALGDTARARDYAHVLDVVVLKQPGAYHRAWSLFLLDHDEHVETVARKVREELKTRKDVYAYDLLAWSLHKEGRDAEAADAMKLALREGTKDALLFHHAEVIERALGHADRARGFAERAANLDPYRAADAS